MWRALVVLAASASAAAAEGGGAIAVSVRRLPPAPVEGLPPASSVATGLWTSCAIASGDVWCWGEMAIFGEGLPDRDKPAKLDAPKHVKQLSLSETGACALDERGQVWCWGRGFDKRPRKILAGTKKVSTGNSFACALRTDERVVCWGRNWDGGLGQGLKKPSPRGALPIPLIPGPVEPPPPWPPESRTPLVVPGADEIADLACGGSYACAAKNSGRVFCWGARDVEKPLPELFGRQRDDDDRPRTITVTRTGERIDIPGIDDAIALNASDRMSCALRRGGAVSCWNFYTHHTPIVGPDECRGIHGAVALDEHGWWAVLPDGQVTRAAYHQCYDGKPEPAVSDVTQASSHCALRRDGVVVCWGSNSHGEFARPAQPFYNERF